MKKKKNIKIYNNKEEIILIMPPNKYLHIQSTYLIPMLNKTKSVKFSVENSVFNPFYGLNINFYLFNMLEVVFFNTFGTFLFRIEKKIIQEYEKNMVVHSIKLDGNRI